MNDMDFKIFGIQQRSIYDISGNCIIDDSELEGEPMTEEELQKYSSSDQYSFIELKEFMDQLQEEDMALENLENFLTNSEKNEENLNLDDAKNQKIFKS